jgi:CRP-like cAMP-binding protein
MDSRSDVPFDCAAFLLSAGLDRRTIELDQDERFFTQGDSADYVFYLQKGRAKLSVVSGEGKQATILLLFPGDFFGEGSLGTEPGLRLATAIAVDRCKALKIRNDEMLRMMHQDHRFCDFFLSYLLERSRRAQADLADQIFNSSEKRLARTLLLMAEIGKPGETQSMIPPITQETLAEMVGTTRSRVSFFMNRFRDLGLISYKERIRVHRPRLQAALRGQFAEV